MEEVSIKTHLIVTEIHEEYHIDWCGKIMNANPKFKNNKPIFSGDLLDYQIHSNGIIFLTRPLASIGKFDICPTNLNCSPASDL